jgi:hypothetical protein
MSNLKNRIAQARKSIADNRASFDRAYKFKVGKTIIRVMPGVKDSDDFSREYGAHYIKDSAGGLVAVVGDAEICYGKICPVRDAIGQHIQRLVERGAPDETVKGVKGWLAKRVNVVNAEILAGDDENKGKVVRCEFSQNSFDAILSVLEEVAESDTFDMSQGVPIIVERVGTGATDTRYTFMFCPRPVPAVSKEALAQSVDLQSYVDGKFGASVNKALTHLSALLGRDVTSTALGAAMATTAGSIAGPKSIDEDLADLAGDTATVDAEFEEKPPFETEAKSKTAAPVDDMEDILAGLDDL